MIYGTVQSSRKTKKGNTSIISFPNGRRATVGPVSHTCVKNNPHHYRACVACSLNPGRRVSLEKVFDLLH